LSGSSVIAAIGSPNIEIENCIIGNTTTTSHASTILNEATYAGTIKVKNSTIVQRGEYGGVFCTSGGGGIVVLDRTTLWQINIVPISGMLGAIGVGFSLYSTDSVIHGGVMPGLEYVQCNNTEFWNYGGDFSDITFTNQAHFIGCRFYGHGIRPSFGVPTIVADCYFDGTIPDVAAVSGTTAISTVSGVSVHVSNCVFANYLSGDIVICGGPSAVDAGSTVAGCNTIDQQLVVECSGAWGNVYTGNSIYEGVARTRPPIDTTTGAGTSRIVDEQQIDTRFLTGESISPGTLGSLAVALNSGGQLVTAMAGQSGRMPAIGIINSGAPQGYVLSVWHKGRAQGNFNFSGYRAGNVIYTGYSGEITGTAPVGAGVLQQELGVITNGSGVFLHGISPTAVSGAIIDAAQFTATNFVAAENISGVRAVAFAGTSGQVQIAMAWLGGSGMFPVQTSRMPAIGVVIDNVLAGATVRVYERGIVSVASGFSSIYASGLLTSGTLYVQASGTITGARPGITSGVNYPVIQTIGSLCQWSGFININPGFVGLANPKPVTVVVDPAGNGDFTDITDATNALTHRGGTVILREGRHIISLSGVIVGSGAVPITYVGAGVSMAVGSGTDVKRGFGTIVDFSNVVLGVASGAFRVGGTGGTQGRTIKFQNIHFWSRFTSGLLFNLGTSAVRDDWIFEDCLIECAGQVFRGTNYPGSIYLNRSKIYLPWPAWSGQPNACTLVGQSQLAIRAVDSDILLGSGNLNSGYIYNGLCESGGQNYLSLYMRHGTLDMGANPISTDGNIMCNLYLEDVAVQNQKNNADASLDPLVVQTARDCTISSFEVSAIDVLHNCTVVGPNSVAVRLLSGMLANIENLKLPSAPTFSGAIWVEDGARGVVNGICAQDIGSFGQLVTDVSASGSRSRITYSNIVWNYASGATHSGYGAVSDGSIIEGQQLYDYRQSIDEFSGPKAVTYAGSGLVQIAMAGISGRMPAVGVSFDSPSSGDGTMFSMGVLIKYWGRVNSFLLNFSGYPVGQSIWVGQSGDLVLTPPTGSGMPQQIIGQVTDGSGMFVGNLCAGLVGSGQITQTMLASGVGGGATTWTTSYVAGEALSGGEFLVFSGAKIVTLAYASGTWDHASVVGVSAAAVLSGASIACETLCGRDVRVQMEASLSGLVAGKPVYLSALSRGACTTIAPTTSGNTSKLLGWISSTSGYLSGSVASSLLSIVFQPGQQILLG